MIITVTCSVPLSKEKPLTSRLFKAGAMSVTRTAQGSGVMLEIIADEMSAEMLTDLCAPYAPVTAVLEEKDWVNEWAKDFTGIEAAPGIMIIPENVEYHGQAETVIRIDPRDAFGAGTHPTTRICCGAIKTLLIDGQYQAGASSFLDIGTGTGVLAILSFLFGMHRIDAFDIEAPSVERAKYNALINGCADIAFTCCGIDTFKCGTPYDIVCANVNSVIIETYFTHILSFAAAGGILILSGIGVQWADSMEQLFAEHSLMLCEKHECDGWLGYILKKP